jgi:hypothetical protein
MIAESPRKHSLDLGPLALNSRFARLVTIQLIIGDFSDVSAPPRFRSKPLEHTRPAAVRMFKAIRMQAGI